MDETNHLGPLIRQARTRAGLSQVQLVDHLQHRLDELPERETVTQGTLSSYETGRAMPSRVKLEALEDVLDLERGALLAPAGYMIVARDDDGSVEGLVAELEAHPKLQGDPLLRAMVAVLRQALDRGRLG